MLHAITGSEQGSYGKRNGAKEAASQRKLWGNKKYQKNGITPQKESGTNNRKLGIENDKSRF